MKIATVLVALTLAGAADDLAATQVGKLKLSAPAAWKRTAQEDGTTRFAAPSGEAYFEVDSGRVQTQGGLEPAVCLTKITSSLGGDWSRLSVDAAPAAVKQDVDKDDSGQEFRTRTYVGCDGKTTWAVTFHLVAKKAARFEPLADKVVQSITYAKGQ